MKSVVIFYKDGSVRMYGEVVHANLTNGLLSFLGFDSQSRVYEITETGISLSEVQKVFFDGIQVWETAE